MTRRLTLLAAALGALLSVASPASAAQRYAAPASTDAVGSCSAMAPCKLDHAVSGASAGDEVIVEPGVYSIGAAISTSVPIDLHGVTGQARPRIVGAANLGGDVVSLTDGGSVSYLQIEAADTLGDALDLERAVGSALVLKNSVGVGATLRGASLLRDSVVSVAGASPAMETKDGKVAGTAKLLNVTLLAPDSGAAALKAKQSSGTETIRNSILRGGSNDVLVYARSSVAIDHSNFRPATSSGAFTDAGANSSADPLLAGYALGAGSPAIDAGAGDADLGPVDVDAAERVFGAAPDVGAFEFGAPRSNWDGSTDPTGTTPTGGSGDTHGNRIAPPTPPKAGEKVNVGPVTGTVKVRTPGGNGYVELGDDASVPVNSTIDVTHGVVELTSARGGGDSRAQTGRFWGGRFQVVQRKRGDGYTELFLKGGSFEQCSAPGRAKAVAAGRRHAVRQLWGQDRHGRFRSHGRRGQATVRGTMWLTQDRCDGTLFAVRKGAIAVKTKDARKTVVLRAGQRYLARTR